MGMQQLRALINTNHVQKQLRWLHFQAQLLQFLKARPHDMNILDIHEPQRA